MGGPDGIGRRVEGDEEMTPLFIFLIAIWVVVGMLVANHAWLNAKLYADRAQSAIMPVRMYNIPVQSPGYQNAKRSHDYWHSRARIAYLATWGCVVWPLWLPFYGVYRGVRGIIAGYQEIFPSE